MGDAQQRGPLPYMSLLSQKQHEPRGVARGTEEFSVRGWLWVSVVSSMYPIAY